MASVTTYSGIFGGVQWQIPRLEAGRLRLADALGRAQDLLNATLSVCTVLPDVILRGASATQRIWAVERSALPDPSTRPSLQDDSGTGRGRLTNRIKQQATLTASKQQLSQQPKTGMDGMQFLVTLLRERVRQRFGR